MSIRILLSACNINHVGRSISHIPLSCKENELMRDDLVHSFSENMVQAIMTNKDTCKLAGQPMNLEHLLFRRQFLLGPRPFEPNQYWSCIQLRHGLRLSTHIDLPVYSIADQELTVTLVGIAINPYNPRDNEVDILHSLVSQASDLDEFIRATMPLAGRWIIIFQDKEETYLFSDPCGLRQIFYYSDQNEFWCASQPELIKKKCPLLLNQNPALLQFLRSPEHVQWESPWLGSSTLYKNCFHLLPNHYLNVGCTKQYRFYPNNDVAKNRSIPDIVQSASTLLQGTMIGLANRYSVNLALTAGIDSRILLAASKPISKDISYFVYRQRDFGEEHPDVWVPRKIAETFNLNFTVKTPSHHLPGWFISLLAQSVTSARILPKTRYIYDQLIAGDNKININGNVSEICRNNFDKYCTIKLKSVSSIDLAHQLLDEQTITEFSLKEIEMWRNELKCSLTDEEGLNILDLLYWEQRMGNWGAQYPAEQDIASEEISPFNCRLLLQTLSSSSRRLRAKPNNVIYSRLIKNMWPEVSDFPINPETKLKPIKILKDSIRPYISPILERKLKNIIQP